MNPALIVHLGIPLLLAGCAEPRLAAESEAGGSGPSRLEQPSSQGRPNRLAKEKSPYLLQHAFNPVDWHPWGEDAFQKAREQDKPIFLSVGYSTCHWCHVMEHESFSNPEIAALMNRHFINVKVDREERPDVDQVYMAFVQASTGRGGWPMSVFLTPDLQPFFGGTYFPPKPMGQSAGFPQVLERVHEEWTERREAILKSAGKITDYLKQQQLVSETVSLQVDRTLEKGFGFYRNSFDKTRGGFGSAPKFPRPANLLFLHRYHRQTAETEALRMSLQTLRHMARGGMYDHLGGGFHRYSTDDNWFLPHFEKMLYDQAQLAVTYLEAYQLSGDAFYAEVARGILDYVLRDMTDARGGFYSAEDADSAPDANSPEKSEGAFYIWSFSQLEEILGKETARLFARRFGVQRTGNVKVDHFDEFAGRNILFVSQDIPILAAEAGKSEEAMRTLLDGALSTLFQARQARPRPLRDDKILTSWNGLMISAFSKASQVLEEPRYSQAARAAARFLKSNLYRQSDLTLMRRFRDGDARIEGFLDDYAFLVQGLLDLYEESVQDEWLLWAFDLNQSMIRRFGDPAAGAFFSTTGRDETIVLRVKDRYDGAEPSPNSVAILNLLRLGQLSNDPELLKTAARALEGFSVWMESSPQSLPLMLTALRPAGKKPRQILIAGDGTDKDTQALLRQVHKRFLPGSVVFLADGGEAHQRLSQRVGVLASLRRLDGKATAYVCEDFVCQLPTTDPQVMGRLLDGGSTD